jgi:hypothetical protein
MAAEGRPLATLRLCYRRLRQLYIMNRRSLILGLIAAPAAAVVSLLRPAEVIDGADDIVRTSWVPLPRECPMGEIYGWCRI